MNQPTNVSAPIEPSTSAYSRVSDGECPRQYSRPGMILRMRAPGATGAEAASPNSKPRVSLLVTAAYPQLAYQQPIILRQPTARQSSLDVNRQDDERQVGEEEPALQRERG